MSYKIKLDQPYSLGKIEHTKFVNKSFLCEAENGYLDIAHYSNHIARVGIHFHNHEDYFSYAAIKKPRQIQPSEIKKNAKSLRLGGSLFDINIKLKEAKVQFVNKSGGIILEDEPLIHTSILGSEVTCFKKIHKDEKFLGLGEKTGDMNRRGRYFINRNSDAFAYGTEQDPIYSSIPFFIGVHSGLMYGVFVDNTYTTQFDFGTSTDRYFSFGSENGSLYYYFVYGESIEEIIEHYTWLTGRMPLPPLWSIGFHQSRYSYYPDYKIDEVVQGFENRGIPLSCLHFDIHYMDKFKAFTFDKKRFPNPKQTIRKLHQKGIHVVPILDPGIKVEKGYFPYDQGVKKAAFVQYVDGELYQGSVWPGTCHFPDFTDPKVRLWWSQLCSYYTDMGIDGLWNDMNEPAVWGQVFPNCTKFDYEGLTASFKKARNIYGLLMTRASLEGLQRKDKNKRYFMLTRAAYAGIQRYSAKWTGDNVATDDHMLLSTRLVSSLGLSGVAFSGSDIGGFVGDSDNLLFARWIALGCFTPFFRAHKMINAKDSEPWCFGEEVEQISKNYITLRYRLMPYLYTQFYVASKKGTPINKPMPMLQPMADWAYDKQYQNQFLFGDSMLVCPIDSKSNYVNIFLPEGEWFDFYTDKLFVGNQAYVIPTNKETIPVFVKMGTIICMQAGVHNVKQLSLSELEIHIYASSTADATTIVYEDDGHTLDYQKKQFYHLRNIAYHHQDGSICINTLHNQSKSKYKKASIFLHGCKHSSLYIDLDGKRKQIKCRKSIYKILDSIPNFDPFIDEEIAKKEVPVYVAMIKI